MYQGVYGDKFLTQIDQVLSFCYVTGLSFYFPWDQLEPSEGTFDWSYIDGALKVAEKHKKKINFGLNVATFSPQWVKERSVTFQYTHPNAHVGKQTAPVPWDAFYVSRLKRLIGELGKRYNNNPNILFVVIDGPATLWGTETNWALIPGSISADDQQKLGFSLTRYRKSWDDMIDVFFDAFPNTDLALALNDGLATSDTPQQRVETVTAIRDYALDKQKHLKPGRKMWIELLGLTNGRQGVAQFVDKQTTGRGMTPYMHLVWDRHGAAHIDYQASVVFRTQTPPYSSEDFKAAMDLGIASGAEIIEVKIWDLFNQNSGEPYLPYAAATRDANERLLAFRPLRP